MNNRKNKNEIKNVIDPFEIEIKPTEIADTVEEVNNETNQNEIEETKTVVGVVVNCKRLNVRQNPSKDSSVLTELTVNDRVVVNLDLVSDKWYKVRIDKLEVDGYCMKEYIAI